MTVDIVPIQVEHIEGFWQAVDTVARERRWLGAFEAYPIASTHDFVVRNIRDDNPQFVAIDDDTIVGWIDIIPSQRPLSLHVGSLGMGILPDYRGQRLGSRLMQTALDKAQTKGLKRVELEVYTHNQAGIALYEKFGFVREGIKGKAAKLDEGYVDMLFMACWLGD